MFCLIQDFGIRHIVRWKILRTSHMHKSRGYTSCDVIIFCVDTHIGLKFCWSSWIEMYFRTMPLCWCYLSRGAQTPIFYEHTTYMDEHFKRNFAQMLISRSGICQRCSQIGDESDVSMKWTNILQSRRCSIKALHCLIRHQLNSLIMHSELKSPLDKCKTPEISTSTYFLTNHAMVLQ